MIYVKQGKLQFFFYLEAIEILVPKRDNSTMALEQFFMQVFAVVFIWKQNLKFYLTVGH